MTRWRARVAAAAPTIVVALAAAYFVAPLLSLARFALQNVPTIRLGWSTLFDNWSLKGITGAFGDASFWAALRLSLQLAVGTVLLTLVLLLPTAIWVHIKLPRARAALEFITVLPYMVPAIALVAGIVFIKPHARWFLNSDLSLIPFYVVLALPFTYRSFDAGLRAIDLRTLVDAARSLGADWRFLLLRVLVPNLRTAIISASFLTAAVVLGEFTLADTLLIESLAPFQRRFVGREPQAGYGLNLLALIATVSLFALVSLLTRKRDRRRRTFAYRAERALVASTPESTS